MSHRLQKFGLLAVPAIICLGLTSCQPSATPPDPTESTTQSTAASPTATQSASPTPAASPTPKQATAQGPAENIPVPKMPAQAKQNSKEGAISFAKHYFEIINYSTATTSTSELKELTSRQCKLCAEQLIDPIDAAIRLDAWQVGGHYDFRLVDVIDSSKNNAIALFHYTADKQELFVAPNKVAKSWDPIESQSVSFELHYSDGWEVIGLVIPET